MRQSVHCVLSTTRTRVSLGHAFPSSFSHRNHGPYPTTSRVVSSSLSVSALLLLRTSLEIAEAQVDPLAQRGEGQGHGQGSPIHTDAIHGHTAPAPAPAHSARPPPLLPNLALRRRLGGPGVTYTPLSMHRRWALDNPERSFTLPTLCKYSWKGARCGM